MNLQLEGKTALVSGGAKGIGASVARLFREEGARVVVVDRDVAAGETLASELEKGGSESVLFVEADLSREADCRKAVEETVGKFGGLDVLVNNAGFNDAVSLDRPPADFAASLNLNLVSAYSLTHFAREALKAARGAIVNVSSKVSVTGQGSTSGYAAAKGGINALTREWAVALAPDGVRVNCVMPAECLTPQYTSWFETQADPAAAKAAIDQLVPLGGRMTTPEEIAAMIVFLASPVSSHTTGQIVFVDGGYTHFDRSFTHGHQKWGEA
ncbi:MAG: L-fucose dehydrogenase [Limisphaerales bacterium]|jgi:NAD(P)-dependent dehydrogenase (short-subunit alcohol dehydrogenase family)